MYSEDDKKAIGRRLRNRLLFWIPVIAALLAVFIVGLNQRWQIVVMVDGPLTFCTFLFAWLMYIGPCVRYLNFLNDMQAGLSRKISGSIVEVSQKEELQDGVRVLPVRIFLDEEEDERIVYLNVTKISSFPNEGEHVALDCFGRHIKAVSFI